jgi:hypothetical protein
MNPATYGLLFLVSAVSVTSLVRSNSAVIDSLNTDEVAEGLTNLYFTDLRARSAISVQGSGLNYNQETGVLSANFDLGEIAVTSVNSQVGDVVLNTDNVTEGDTNKYFTEERSRQALSVGGDLQYDSTTGLISFTDTVTSVNSQVGDVVLNTDNVTEGDTNKYFTEERSRQALSVGGDLQYDSTTGLISFTDTVTSVNSQVGDVVLNTDNVAEGDTNKYFTEERSRNTLSGGDGITYNNTTGVITSLITSKWIENDNNIYFDEGNVGIGTSTPNAKLHIYTEMENVNVSEDAAFVWVTRSSAVDSRWQSITWSPDLGLFAAVAIGSGTENRIMTSPDGIEWATRTSTLVDWRSVIWASEIDNDVGGKGMFVAVSSGSFKVMTSSDGVTWTVNTSSLPTGQWQSVVWAPEIDNGEGGNGLLVAVSSGPSSNVGNRVMTSPDGFNWTSRTSAADLFWQTIAWSPELEIFVALGRAGALMTSPDGFNWTQGLTDNTNSFSSVIWVSELDNGEGGYGLFVAVGEGPGNNRAMTSPNGIDWTSRETINNSWSSVTWSTELNLLVSVAVGFGSGNRVMTSPDGIFWTTRTSAADNGWKSVTWAPELRMFAAVAETGEGDRVMTTIPYSLPSPSPLAIFGEAPLPEPEGSMPLYLSRAWINFNGITGEIRSSGNISSITRNSIGDYTINFNSAMPDGNYSFVFGGSKNNNGEDCHFGAYDDQINTTSLRIKTWSRDTNSFVNDDLSHISLIISR